MVAGIKTAAVKSFKSAKPDLSMKFVKIGDILEGKYTGKKVAIRGWVYRERKQKTVSFFLIREDSGVIQTAIKPDSEFWEIAQKLTIESSVEIEGEVREDKRAPGERA